VTRDRVSRARQQIGQKGIAAYGLMMARRAVRRCFNCEQVILYSWNESTAFHAALPHGYDLVPIDLDLLATAAIEHSTDEQTLDYLLRSAARLHAGEQRGLALTDESKIPVHFCWSSAFRDFKMAELKTSVSAPVDNANVIYDCWTPAAVRGRGFYGITIAHVAERLTAEGRTPWIFSAAENISSIRGIEKSGFERRYALLQSKDLFVRRLRTQAIPTFPASLSQRAS